MKPSIRKVKDILGNYFEISHFSGKVLCFGYEISEHGEFLDKMHVILNEKAIDFIAENPSCMDWDRVFVGCDIDAKAYIESTLHSLGFNSVFFFFKNSVNADVHPSSEVHAKSIA